VKGEQKSHQKLVPPLKNLVSNAVLVVLPASRDGNETLP